VNLKAQRLLLSLDMAPPGPVAEVGSARYPTEVDSDGFSTVYLARRCRDEGRLFYSFDKDWEVVKNANAVLQEHGLLPLAVCDDGAVGLARLAPLALLYLDGSDDPLEAEAQYRAATFAPGAVVVIDDANSYNGREYGKADRLYPLLQECGASVTIHDTERPANQEPYRMLVAVLP